MIIALLIIGYLLGFALWQVGVVFFYARGKVEWYEKENYHAAGTVWPLCCLMILFIGLMFAVMSPIILFCEWIEPKLLKVFQKK